MIGNGVPSDPYTNVCGHVGAVVKVIIGCCRIGDGVILILNAVQPSWFLDNHYQLQQLQKKLP